MALLETDNCWPGNGWVGGTESPAGWRYFAGTGQGATGPYRPMPAGTIYAEFDGYWDQVSGDNFLRVGLKCNNSALAWNPNGYSVMIRVADGALTVQGGTYVLGSDNSVAIGMHHTSAFAFTIGIGIDGSDMLVYYGGQLVYRLTNMTAPQGTYALASAYNGAGGHYNEVRFYDALPEVVEPAPLPDLLETDDCWPGRGWVDGTESPAGWRYFNGTGTGPTGPRRPTPEGTVYAEWDFYWDSTGGDRWIRMGLWSPDMLNWSPGGYTVTVSPATGQVNVPWPSNATYLVGSPGSLVLGARRTPATAATIGIGIIDGDTAVYYNGEMAYRVRAYGMPLGPWTLASAYNGGAGHFNEVRFYSVLPASTGGEPFVPLAIARIQSDLNSGVGLTDATRKAGIQSDLNLGVGLTDATRKASVQADVNPTRIYGIQADVNVSVLYSGGSGNMPIGPGLDSR
jgi:hypothetical protein